MGFDQKAKIRRHGLRVLCKHGRRDRRIMGAINANGAVQWIGRVCRQAFFGEHLFAVERTLGRIVVAPDTAAPTWKRPRRRTEAPCRWQLGSNGPGFGRDACGDDRAACASWCTVKQRVAKKTELRHARRAVLRQASVIR